MMSRDLPVLVPGGLIARVARVGWDELANPNTLRPVDANSVVAMRGLAVGIRGLIPTYKLQISAFCNVRSGMREACDCDCCEP